MVHVYTLKFLLCSNPRSETPLLPSPQVLALRREHQECEEVHHEELKAAVEEAEEQQQKCDNMFLIARKTVYPELHKRYRMVDVMLQQLHYH